MKLAATVLCILLPVVTAFPVGIPENRHQKTAGDQIVIRHFLKDRPESAVNNDMLIVRELSRRTGVTFKWETVPSDRTQAIERFNIMTASGNIPDIVSWDELAFLSKAALQGLFEPLNSLVETGAPNLGKVLEENPGIRRDITLPDGNFYVFPFLCAVRPAEIFIIRQDWLDKLGLMKPVTREEWYTVLKAFRDRDPNGNGKPDEIPFVVRTKARGVLAFASAFGLDGWIQEFMVKDDSVIYPYIDPRMKDALSFINRLYREKLIDGEFITTDVNIWAMKLGNETAGVTYDWWPRIDYFQNAVKPFNPDVRFSWAMPPAGPDGKPFTVNQQNPVRGGTAISRTSKHKSEIVRFLDYSYGAEGNLLRNFGLEGVHYTMKDGRPIFTEAAKNAQGGPLYALSSDGHREFAYRKDPWLEEQVATSAASAEAFKAYDPIIRQALPELAFTPEEQKVISSIYTDIQAYKNEMIDRFIMGLEPIDRFEIFTEKIRSMGIGTVLSIYNSAYRRYLSVR